MQRQERGEVKRVGQSGGEIEERETPTKVLADDSRYSRTVSGSGFTTTETRREKHLNAFISSSPSLASQNCASFCFSLLCAQHSPAVSQVRLFSRECFASKKRRQTDFDVVEERHHFPHCFFCTFSFIHKHCIQPFASLCWRAVWRFLHVEILHVGKKCIHACMLPSPSQKTIRCIGKSCCTGNGRLGLFEQWQSICLHWTREVPPTLPKIQQEAGDNSGRHVSATHDKGQKKKVTYNEASCACRASLLTRYCFSLPVLWLASREAV